MTSFLRSRVAAFLLLTSCVLSCSRPDPKVVRIAYVPAAYYLPIFVMTQQRLLEKRGYRADTTSFHDNSQMLNMFANDELDVTAQSALTLFKDESEQPTNILWIYGQRARSYLFIVPESSSVRSIADLRGKTIGTWRSPTADRFIRLIMQAHGIHESEYAVNPYGARDWPGQLLNGTVSVAFGFDVPAASLVASGKFRYVDPSAVADLVDGGAFNGGAFVSRSLQTRDSAKFQAIVAALREAIAIIREHPEIAHRAAATFLQYPDSIVARSYLDEFMIPDSSLIAMAERTRDLMLRAGIVNKTFDVRRMFVLSNSK